MNSKVATFFMLCVFVAGFFCHLTCVDSSQKKLNKDFASAIIALDLSKDHEDSNSSNGLPTNSLSHCCFSHCNFILPQQLPIKTLNSKVAQVSVLGNLIVLGDFISNLDRPPIV